MRAKPTESETKYQDEFREFTDYCATLTDEQLVAVVHKEREGCQRNPDRGPHFSAAMSECNRRNLDWRQ